jgi:glycosyltransferase involved in cell wall biosynthesis
VTEIAERAEPAPRPPLLISGPFPPPVHGAATITIGMAGALAGYRRIVRANLAVGRMPPEGGFDLGYHGARLWRNLIALASIIPYRTRGGRSLYLACSGGHGIAYEIVLLAFARLLGLQRVVHHHSFKYIDRRSRLMAALVGVGGRAMTHIFLCDGMRAAFEERYRQTRALVLPNDYFVDRRRAPAGRADGPLRIGFLSNLTAEKGLPDFLALLRAASAQGLATGVLAGPAEGGNLAQIEAAQRDLGPSLDYRGPVHGAAKAQFFDDIDIFVFPTRYAHEAQPMVICEAMAVGLPVLAFDRGCIAGQLGDALPPPDRNADFLPWALDHIRGLGADRAALARLGEANAARAAAKAAEGAEVLR